MSEMRIRTAGCIRVQNTVIKIVFGMKMHPP
nr:MAG TPA: ErfK/YbiS/YcfS/YnhG family protein [Caudoviricetes sp.]